jgi:hypothetical protein
MRPFMSLTKNIKKKKLYNETMEKEIFCVLCWREGCAVCGGEESLTIQKTKGEVNDVLNSLSIQNNKKTRSSFKALFSRPGFCC